MLSDSDVHCLGWGAQEAARGWWWSGMTPQESAGPHSGSAGGRWHAMLEGWRHPRASGNRNASNMQL